MENHYDVLVVGAGISGIGAGYHLQTKCPKKSYAILEGRDTIGGTWDLFRYPGIRSDSDMYTLGFSFYPWKEKEAIANGPSILKYLQKMTCNFIFMCSGYYSYKEGYTPDFKGIDNFNGQIIHPQKWTDDVNYNDKNVIVIGSGATAVTIVPEMAKKAKHVTMLQRSPTYVVSAPEKDPVAKILQNFLPNKAAYFFVRWKNIIRQHWFFTLCKKNPKRVKDFILSQIRKELGPNYDIKKHFTPNYNPWDQRMCLVPNGDLFESIKNKKASVVTDQIDHFTDKGIKLKSGDELGADLVVTATGLNMELLSNIELIVDEEKIDLSKTITYKGMMFSGVPNLVSTFGYTNASWTLGADLTSEYVCRLINLMEKKSLKKCCPEANDNIEQDENYLNLSSGYIERSKNFFGVFY